MKVSRKWTPDKIKQVALNMLKNYSNDAFATMLKDRLCTVSGVHIVTLMHVLDAIMKWSTVLHTTIRSCFQVFPEIRFAHKQCDEERVWVADHTRQILQHWVKRGYLLEMPVEISAYTQYVPDGYTRYFKRIECNVQQSESCTTPEIVVNLQDGNRECPVCGDVVHQYFSDRMNTWVTSEGYRNKDGKLTHLECVHSPHINET
jgi:hypothetical protein